jgi:hypothetical protein
VGDVRTENLPNKSQKHCNLNRPAETLELTSENSSYGPQFASHPLCLIAVHAKDNTQEAVKEDKCTLSGPEGGQTLSRNGTCPAVDVYKMSQSFLDYNSVIYSHSSQANICVNNSVPRHDAGVSNLWPTRQWATFRRFNFDEKKSTVQHFVTRYLYYSELLVSRENPESGGRPLSAV